MLIEENQKFVFVHVQKAAGISMARVGIREIGRAHWDGYYRFGFVQNPWDRMVSWYAMIQAQRKQLPFLKRFTKRPFKMELWNYAVRTSHDFESFLENCNSV